MLQSQPDEHSRWSGSTLSILSGIIAILCGAAGLWLQNRDGSAVEQTPLSIALIIAALIAIIGIFVLRGHNKGE